MGEVFPIAYVTDWSQVVAYKLNYKIEKHVYNGTHTADSQVS